MRSNGVVRMALLAAGLAVAAAASLPSDFTATAQAGVSSGEPATVSRVTGLAAQQGNPCERTRRPACGRPGRRSTHR